MLLEHSASMFVENADKDTPCDCAERHQHIDIAQLLESKMVFSVSLATFSKSVKFRNHNDQRTFSAGQRIVWGHY